MQTITHDNKSYKVEVKKVKTNSNYNLGVNVYFQKDKMPFWGTILNEKTNATEILSRALNAIKNNPQGER